MSEPKAVYTVEPSVVTAATQSEVNDAMGGLQPNPPMVPEATHTGEEAAQPEAESQPEAQVEQPAEAEMVGELQASIAARDAQIADLKAKLAEAEQRAALPPLAGNPATSSAPAEAHGYDLIRKAIEAGQTQFDF